ncbi:hypothetical protein BOX15_Mlig011002g7 [Macrostomum lignano]|uniref:Uncharacterized protein n=1 Tax=Macrostomum lignano TaxID=282301 RepID=A0A267E8F1_9PLAT|nr:hypothetical protein BOX15_Mlig011002g7 [Macrostomum lignano]
MSAFSFGASPAASAGPKLATVAPLAAGSSSTLGGLNLSLTPQQPPAFGAAASTGGSLAAAGAAGGTPGAAGGPAAAGQSSTIVGLNLSSTTPLSSLASAPSAPPAAGQPAPFGFGASATGAKPATAAAPSGAPAPAFGSFFGAASASTTGAPAAAAPGAALKGLGGAGASTQSSTIVGLNLSTAPLSLAAPAAASAAAKPALSLTLGAAPTAAAAPAPGGFSFGTSAPAPGASTLAAAATSAPAAAAPAFRGLGGVPGSSLASGSAAAGSGGAGIGGFGAGSSSGSGGAGASGSTTEAKSVLESEIPHEVLVTVEAFRRHVASQRELRLRMEADRAGLAQELGRVAEEAESVAQAVRRLATGRAASVSAAVRLRSDLAELGRQLSVARRSFEQPAWQQADSQEALDLLGQLVTEAAGKIRLLRAEIEDLEAALCLDGSSGRVSGQELLNALRQAREALVACAAELGAASATCDRLRADFLAYRRSRGDFRNPFAASASPRAASATSPFSGRGRHSNFGPPPCDDSLAAASAAATAAAAAASVATQPAAAAPSLFGGAGGFGGFSAAGQAAPAFGATAASAPFAGFGAPAGGPGGGLFGFSAAKRKP